MAQEGAAHVQEEQGTLSRSGSADSSYGLGMSCTLDLRKQVRESKQARESKQVRESKQRLSSNACSADQQHSRVQRSSKTYDQLSERDPGVADRDSVGGLKQAMSKSGKAKVCGEW